MKLVYVDLEIYVADLVRIRRLGSLRRLSRKRARYEVRAFEFQSVGDGVACRSSRAEVVAALRARYRKS